MNDFCRAGVNRQRDMPRPEGMALLDIVPDWDSLVYNADELRLFNRSAYQHYPAGSHVVNENESDEDVRDGQSLTTQSADVQAAYNAAHGQYASEWWYYDHQAEIRRARRISLYQAMRASGMIVHCPAERPDQRPRYDPQVIAETNEVDFHFGVLELVNGDGSEADGAANLCEKCADIADGRPWNGTEFEADPAHPEQMALIPTAMRVALKYGAKKVYAWGNNPTRANINDFPYLLAEIRQINIEGVAPVAEGDPETSTPVLDPPAPEVPAPEVPATPPTGEQAERAQEEAQISGEAEAFYGLVNFIRARFPDADTDPGIQHAKTYLNSLNPDHFSF